MPFPVSFPPCAPPVVQEWAIVARVGLEAGPRSFWPTSWWAGMATSLGLHGAVVAAAIGLGATWSLVLFPPRNDISSSAQKRGSAIVVHASWARPEQEPATASISVARAEKSLSDAASPVEPSTHHRRGEIEFDPVETSEPAPQLAAAQTAERATPSEASSSASATSQTEARPTLARNSSASAPSLPGTFDSRAARGTKNNAPPKTLFSPDPIYPPELLAARQSGRVLVRIRVTPAGQVTQAVLHRTSGWPAFDRSALEAVQKWRFEPIAGAPSGGIEAIVPVSFSIAEQAR